MKNYFFDIKHKDKTIYELSISFKSGYKKSL